MPSDLGCVVPGQYLATFSPPSAGPLSPGSGGRARRSPGRLPAQAGARRKPPTTGRLRRRSLPVVGHP
jgi:hypothetical protein